MVESPMYERLMRLVAAIEKASELDAWDDQHNKVVCGLNEANNSTYHMRTNQGFTGETGQQIDDWTGRAMKQVQAIKDGHNTAMEYYVEARRTMKQVREEAMQLSPTLIDSKLEALADAAHVVIPVAPVIGPFGLLVNAVAAKGEAYVQGLVEQANNQREVAATDILQRANDTMQGLADGTNAQRQQMDDGLPGIGDVRYPAGPSNSNVRNDIERGYLNTSANEAGVYPGNRDTDYGRSDLRGSGSGLYPGGYDEGGPISDRVMSSPRVPDRFADEGEVGSRLNPISDPQDLMDIDLLHTRVNGDRHRNGVIGGYTPAPPVDRYHPLWNVNGGPGSESALAGRLGGAGLLGAGALGVHGASRMGGGIGASASALSRGGAGSLGRGGVAGAGGLSSLRAGSYSGPGYGTYKPPSADGGAAGIAGAQGSRGASGTGATGSGRAGAQGAGGFMGGGAGAGAGGGKDDKKARRRKYTPFRVEDEDELPEGYVNPMSQTYGTDKDLAPAQRRDDGWDLRQW
jgi:PE_PGRS family protein